MRGIGLNGAEHYEFEIDVDRRACRSAKQDRRGFRNKGCGPAPRLGIRACQAKSLKFGARGKVAPKFRNPENPSETWAGRGLKPRWLAAAIKSGKKLDDFRIAGSGKDGAGKSARKKTRAKRR
jgi:hypothetical protein